MDFFYIVKSYTSVGRWVGSVQVRLSTPLLVIVTALTSSVLIVRAYHVVSGDSNCVSDRISNCSSDILTSVLNDSNCSSDILTSSF